MPPEAAAPAGSGCTAGTMSGAAGPASTIVDAAEAAVSGTGSPTSARAALPAVLADVPVAVLVIDRSAGAVVYANAAAIELAGNVRLPLAVDAWGTAVGLTDVAGSPLAGTANPLSGLAAGRPLTGEAVRLAPGRRRGRGTPDLPGDELLWVTGFPLSEDSSSQQLSLVVFLALEDGNRAADPETSLRALRDRAVVATDIAFTITDPRQDDDPLVWVNPSFSRITGYSYAESVGRNCRFLQGAATDPATVEEIRKALQAQQPVSSTLLNHRRDGTAFWNQLSITPVFDGEGQLISFVGVQTDVTERVRVEDERAAAFAAERAARREAEQARADAERAQSQLALMAEATGTLGATLDMSELFDRLAGLCVPQLADWVFLTMVDEHGTVRDTAFRHRDGREDLLREFAALHAMSLPESSPSRHSLTTSEPVLIEQVTPEWVDRVFPAPATAELFARLGGSSVLTVPLVARRRTLGAMALVTGSGRSFCRDDLELARDLSRRAAMAMDNVRLYQQEHTVAETLQRSLLPELPAIPGIAAAARYLSASTAAEVGGDFYDLLPLPDGAVAVAVGDVLGHDLAAAAAMGHLRGLLRACMWDDADPDPGAVLTRLDRLVQGLQVAQMATIVYVRAVRPATPGGPWRLELGNAGHPPMLLRHPDGTVRQLDGVTGLLVGVAAGSRRNSVVVEVPAGTVLVAYTDGLIESPGQDLDQGIAALAARLAAAPVDAAPEELCRHAVGPAPDRRDDVAVIAVRFD